MESNEMIVDDAPFFAGEDWNMDSVNDQPPPSYVDFKLPLLWPVKSPLILEPHEVGFDNYIQSCQEMASNEEMLMKSGLGQSFQHQPAGADRVVPSLELMPDWMQRQVQSTPFFWELFQKQADAIQFCKECGQGLKCFSFEISIGARGFLCAHSDVFWFYYNTIRLPENRHSYEVITEGDACKLYFDLEFKKADNIERNGVCMTNTFIKVVSWFLKMSFGIECDRKYVLDLDSSTEEKFSRHLIFNLANTCFKDNNHVGKFVKVICQHLQCGYQCPIVMSELAKNCSVFDEDLRKLFVNAKNGSKRLFCDDCVYLKNRHFRLWKSSKINSGAILLVSPENEYEPTASTLKPLPGMDLFLASLITFDNVNVSGIRVLDYETVNCKNLIQISTVSIVESLSAASHVGKLAASHNEKDQKVIAIPKERSLNISGQLDPVFVAWSNIVAILGQPKLWGPMGPVYRKAFWSTDPSYKERMFIATLSFYNGLNPELVQAFLSARKVPRHKIQKTINLWRLWTKGNPTDCMERMGNDWSFDIARGVFAYLNKTLRPGQEQYLRNH